METIYLDYNATTPIHPLVADAMRPYLDTIFGNPSSTHAPGMKAKEAVENARKQVAGMLNGHRIEQFRHQGDCSGRPGERKPYHHLLYGTSFGAGSLQIS